MKQSSCAPRDKCLYCHAPLVTIRDTPSRKLAFGGVVRVCTNTDCGDGWMKEEMVRATQSREAR